jgi:hypothetical protein
LPQEDRPPHLSLQAAGSAPARVPATQTVDVPPGSDNTTSSSLVEQEGLLRRGIKKDPQFGLHT